MQMDFVQRFFWPTYWAELAIFLLLAMIVMSKGAVGGLITFVPVLFLLLCGALVALTGSVTLRNLLAAVLGLGAWLMIMGVATFLWEQIKR